MYQTREGFRRLLLRYSIEMGSREKNSRLLSWHFTYVVKKFTIQDRDTCRWGGVSSEEKLFYFLFFSFLQLQKVTRKKQQLDQKLLPFQQREGKLEKKREREKPRERNREKKRERDRQWDHSPVWDTIKKYPAICLPFRSLFFFFLFSSLLSFSLNVNIHPRIHPRKNHKIPRKTRA